MGKSIKQGLKRFLFLAIAWLLAGLAVIIYGVQSDLVNFFLPTRFIVLFCLLAGAAVLVLYILLNVASSRKKWIFAVIMAALIVLSMFVYIREFRAYREIELSFQNEGTELAGTLYLPRQPGKYAAIVIAQGSIRAPRRLYHFWADQLVRDGYAVFSFDKRGTGASGGEYESENNSSSKNLHLLASDVAAAVNAARHHPEIDGEHVGIFGLSMGGWLGPLVAQMTDSVSFMILVSGPAVSVGEENYFSDLAGEGHRGMAKATLAEIDSLVMLREPSGYDPRAILQELEIPTLWLFGGSDLSVPVVKSKAVLDEMITQYRRPFEVIIYPEARHLGFVMQWPFDLAPGFWPDVREWLSRQSAQP